MSAPRFCAACILIAASTTLGRGHLHAFPPESALEQQLKKPIDISFENTPLKEVLEELRDKHGINIVPDKPALDEEGISLESPISMKPEQVSLRSTLVLILHQVKITYVIKDDVLQITTLRHAHAKPKRRTYPVAGLLKGPMTEATLIDLITRSIAPGYWRITGGKGTIRYSQATGYLTVHQEPWIQKQIQDLLAALVRLQDREVPGERPSLTPTAGR